jgi:hypothetical protein
LLKKLFIALSLLPAALVAQVLLPTPETAFEAQHNFNPEVIRRNNVKRITFEIIDKRDFEIAVDKNLVENYEFNSEGQLTRYYYTNISKTIERHVPIYGRHGKRGYQVVNDYVYDTIGTSYFYEGKNLVLKRYHDGAGYYESRYYRYDKEGHLTKELRYKETNNSADKKLFILGNQLQLSEDSFQYQKFKSGQVKCIFLNNENRPYKERITNVDSLGRKISENENYTVAAWIMQQSNYTYDEKRLLTAKFEGNASNRIVLRNTYEYDEKKELYAEKQYRNDVLLKEISYVSDRNNGLLNSFVVRDPINKSIRIVKLKYDFGLIGKSGE